MTKEALSGSTKYGEGFWRQNCWKIFCDVSFHQPRTYQVSTSNEIFASLAAVVLVLWQAENSQKGQVRSAALVISVLFFFILGRFQRHPY